MKNFFIKLWKVIKESKVFKILIIIFSVLGSIILVLFNLSKFKFLSPKEKEFDKKVKKAKETNDKINTQIDTNKKEVKDLNNKINKNLKSNTDKQIKRKKKQQEVDEKMKKYIKD